MIGPAQRSSHDCSLEGHVALGHEMPGSEYGERHIEQYPGHDAWGVPTHLECPDKMEDGVRDQESREEEPAKSRVRRGNRIPEVDPSLLNACLPRAREGNADREHDQERIHDNVEPWGDAVAKPGSVLSIPLSEPTGPEELLCDVQRNGHRGSPPKPSHRCGLSSLYMAGPTPGRLFRVRQSGGTGGESLVGEPPKPQGLQKCRHVTGLQNGDLNPPTRP
jgi:hypothetical protein